MRERASFIRRYGRVAWIAGLAMIAAGARVEADDATPARAVVTGTVVDEAAKPVAGVTVEARTWEDVEPARSGADGSFRLTLPTSAAGRVRAMLVARSDDGRLGLQSVTHEATRPEAVRITLKPSRPLEVRVVDGGGRPVAGAAVHVLAGFYRIAGGQTDDGGRWSQPVPADLKAWGVYALRSKVGFDYAQAERARDSAEPPLPLPDRLTLTLDGARPTLRVKAVDQNGKPLKGIEVGPWLIRKPGLEAEMNGMTDAFVTTGEDGIAAFDWLPARIEGKISIVSRPTDYYAPDHATWIDADKPIDEVTIHFLPLERLSGRVTTADGRPAAGASVRLEGQGAGNHSYRGATRTGPDGRYALRVHSEQAYIITATKDELAAPYRSGVVVRAGKPVEGVDLVLGTGTRVKGRVTVGKDGKPAPKVSVSAVIDKGSIPLELRREGDRYYRGITLSSWTQTDGDGRFEFLLGPGEYTIQGPARVEPVKVTIPTANPPRELVHNFVMPRPQTGPFTATVVDLDGKPVAGAVVDGAYQAMTAFFRRVVADAQGTIRIDRSLDPLVLVATSPDRSRAGIMRVDAEATEARIVLKPTATASARLTDPRGAPIADQKLNYGIRVTLSPDRTGPFSWYFGGTATTDDSGHFRLDGLLLGESYEIYTYLEGGSRIPSSKTKVKPDAPGPLALGDVPIDLSPPKPYVPPTPAELTAEAFAARKEKSPREKLDYVLVEAEREYTRPLLLFGASTDPACIELFRLFDERSDGEEEAKGKAHVKSPGDLRWEFELATLDARRDDVKALARDLGLTLGGGDPPRLAVLSNEGKLTASYALRLGSDKKLDAGALGAFLLEHKLPTRDAEGMLSDGLAQAKAGQKRVFLIMSASWCGPCRMLARFLTAHKTELGPHYVFVKLDVSRDTHAQALVERYEGKDAANGVPWYVILDPAGKPLITSNAKEIEEYGMTNIGFPSSKEGIDHFLGMLRQTAPGLSEQTLTALRRQLEKRP